MKKLIVLSACLMLTVFGFSQTTYEVGKVYEINGAKGLVYKVSDGGKHGKMMSLKACDEKIWLKDKKFDQETRVFDQKSGKTNTQTVEKFIKDNNLSWDVFPIFKWANELGEGWFIPAKDELAELALFITNSKDGTFNKDRIKELNKILKDNDGDALDKVSGYSKVMCVMYSSTEATNTDKKGNKLFFCLFQLGLNNQLRIDGWKKVKAYPANMVETRAIREF